MEIRVSMGHSFFAASLAFSAFLGVSKDKQKNELKKVVSCQEQGRKLWLKTKCRTPIFGDRKKISIASLPNAIPAVIITCTFLEFHRSSSEEQPQFIAKDGFLIDLLSARIAISSFFKKRNFLKNIKV